VSALVEAGAKVEAADASGGVALTYAAASGSAAAVDVLQKHRAEPTPHDGLVAPPRRAAPPPRGPPRAGVKPDAAAGGGRVPLLTAARENCADTVALILDRGANVNVADADGRTALITATAAGFTEVVRVLLAHGADMDVADTLERTAWMYAATQ